MSLISVPVSRSRRTAFLTTSPQQSFQRRELVYTHTDTHTRGESARDERETATACLTFDPNCLVTGRSTFTYTIKYHERS